MTSDQYTELVEFLGRRFDGMDRRLDGMDRRLDGMDQRLDGVDQRLDGVDARIEESRRHATVLFEQARHERRTMMEGLEARFEARFDALGRTVASLDASVRATLADHEARLRALE